MLKCKCHPKLSTGYPQVPGEPLPDLLDVPEFFGDDDAGINFADTDDGPRWPTTDTEVATAYGGTGDPVPVPRVKDASVALPRSPEMSAALAVAAQRGDLVTSGAEGHPADRVHSPTSQHYRSLALDVRWAADRAAQIRAYREAGYVAVPEATHLHVQRYRA